ELDPDRSFHQVMRTERFAVTGAAIVPVLRDLWSGLVDHADGASLSAITLNHARHEGLVEVVRVAPLAATSPEELAADPSVGLLVPPSFERVFDRTQLVLTVWSPYVAGDRGEPAAWPNSPPLPGPTCGDGVCVPSQGEDGASCAADCPPRCGDLVCQPD